MTIRDFRIDDVESILTLWNESLWDELDTGKPDWYVKRNLFTKPQLIEKIHADAYDSSGLGPEGFHVADQNNILVGFAGGTVEDGAGHIKALIVHPAFRRTGIGAGLYEKVLTYFRTQGARSVTLDFGKWHFRDKTGVFEGSPEYHFLAGRGLEPTRKSIVFILCLKDFRVKDEVRELRKDLERDDIHIRFYEPGYTISLSRIEEPGFRTSWKRIEETYKEEKGLIATQGRRVVGFNEPGKGPFVDPDYRGRKIGKVLVGLGCLEAKRRGAWFSYFRTEVDNYSAINVYLYTGYQKLGEIYTAVKPIDI